MKRRILWLSLFAFISLHAQQELDTMYIRLHRTDSLNPLSYLAGMTLSISDSLVSVQPSSVAEWLSQAACIDMRGSGRQGVVADISLKGSGFNQYAVLINGLPVYFPQTGHHFMHLPLDPLALSRIQVLDGAGAGTGTANVYAGALDFVTLGHKPGLHTEAEAGSFGRHRLAALANYEAHRSGFQFLAYHHASGGYLKTDTVDNTDFRRSGAFVLYHRNFTPDLSLMMQSGIMNLSAGLNRQYAPAFPWEFEKIRSRHAGMDIRWTPGSFYGGIKAAYNQLKDRFELFREDVFQYRDGYYIRRYESGGRILADTARYGPGAYYGGANIHLTCSLDGQAYAGYKWTGRQLSGFVQAGWTLNRRSIRSNSLGPAEGVEPLYFREEKTLLDHGAVHFDRQAYAFLYLRHKDWEAVLRNHFVAGDENKLLPGLKITRFYHHSHFNRLSFSVGKGFRRPTFTEWYYQGPANLGNPQLKPEENLEINLQARGRWPKTALEWHAEIFHRNELRYIDWIKRPGENRWHAENLGGKHTTGFITRLAYTPPFAWFRKAELRYQYIYSDKTEKDFDSKYGADYLRHHLHVRLMFIPASIRKNPVRLNLDYDFRQRNGLHPTAESGFRRLAPYKPVSLWNLSLAWKPAEHVKLFVRIENLTGVQAYDLAFVPMPGRRVSAGIKWYLPY
ncbi:MAG: TonB-dependent receptor [Chlorobi bacterium]|nr:TonB-dependent receptor [Chlorobiota bacterium]